MSRRAARTTALALAFVVCRASTAAAAEPAAGGPPLVDACESAALVALGTVERPQTLDVQGRVATFIVERVLAGSTPAEGTLRIAWEELAQSRPDRFADGDRILAALTPVPSGSLWRQRFPVSADAPPVLAIAAGGGAFLRRPDEATIDRLARWAQLMPEERGGTVGAEALARIVAGAHPVVALAATERLARMPQPGVNLGANGMPVLAAAIGDPARPDAVRSAILQLAGAQRLTALRPAILSLATPGNALEAEAIEALALLDGGIASEGADALLRRPDPRVRIAAARHLDGPGAGPRLASLVRSDPAPGVRAAATTALLDRGAAGAEDDATPALFDVDSSVRAAAAQGFGRLGDRAVPRLRQLALARQGDDARGPIAALSLAGASGAEALREIATTHPDEPTRRLAAFALGHVPSHDRGMPMQEAPERGNAGEAGSESGR